ncbi:hypothetical protein HDU77_004729 [Chytriomyces hyalinus]|nr:hypothetical protein HDU77_004729 [Chytriomyces hyalinus]
MMGIISTVGKVLNPFGGGGPLVQVPQGAIQAVVQRGAAQVSVNLNAIPVMATVGMMLCFTTVLLHPGLVSSIDVQLVLCVVLGVTAAAYVYVSRSRPPYTLQRRPDTGIFVYNGTGSPIQVAISTNTGPGSAESFLLQPGCSDTWMRGNGHEVVVVESGNKAMGMCVRTGVRIAVEKVENMVPPQFRVEADGRDGQITIENQSGRDAKFFVTKRSNPDGDDGWYEYGHGQVDSWARMSSEVIVAEQDSVRVGVYANAGSRVVFLGNYGRIVINGRPMCDISDDALAAAAAPLDRRSKAKNPSNTTTLRNDIIANVTHICEGNPKAANENGTVSILLDQTQFAMLARPLCPGDNSTYFLPFIEVAGIKYFLLKDVIYYEKLNEPGKTVTTKSCRKCRLPINRKLEAVLSHMEGCLGLSSSAIGLYTYQSSVELSATALRTAPQQRANNDIKSRRQATTNNTRGKKIRLDPQVNPTAPHQNANSMQSNSSIHINNMHSAPMGHQNYMCGLHVHVDDVGAVIPGFSALDISSKKEEKSDKVASDHKTYIKSEADAETSLSSCSGHKEEPIERIRNSADDFVEAKPQPAQSGPNNPPYTIQHRIDTDIFVHNGTGSPIQVAVSKNSGSGSAESFLLQPGCSDTWKRDGRFVSVEIKAGEKSMGFDVPTGVNIAVKKVENTVPPQFRIEAGGTPGKITIENQSGRDAKFFVTKRSNPDGDDAWYEYGHGQVDSWGRMSSEVIVAEQDSVRVGVYANAGSRVVFLGN